MVLKIISALMSVIVSLTGVNFVSPEAVVDSFAELFFGVPYSQEAVERGFIDTISDDDVDALNKERGFVKDKLMLFIGSETSFFDKVKIINSTGGVLVGWCAPLELYVVSYLPMTFDEATAKAQSLQAIDGVELASPLFASKYASQFTPDDPFYDETDSIPVEQTWDEIFPEGRNWWLEAIDARQAWDYGEYFGDVVTGICDSGFDTEHPEIEGKISFPTQKQANRNIPDDHGTHVAGVIAAKHNSQGIAGICENAKLMCVDWSPEFAQFWIADIAIIFGFSDLVKAGSKVINFSLGSASSVVGYETSTLIKMIESAIYSRSMASLISKGYDFVVVQSAGNGNAFGEPINTSENGLFCGITLDNAFVGSTGVSAQEVLDRIIIVGAAENNYDGTMSQSYFSNIGDTVSISAPGSDIYSCTYSYPYDVFSGTSMSAPIVTAVASLVWSVNPGFDGVEVKDIVTASYDTLLEPNVYAVDYYEEIGVDAEFCSYGVVNAKLSVEEALLRTYETFGSVEGSVSAESEAEYVTFGGKEYTVLSDGSFSFVAQAGSGKLAAFDADGNELCSTEINVTAGGNTVAEF